MRPDTKVKIIEPGHMCFGRIGYTKSTRYGQQDGTPYIPVITRDDKDRRCTSFHKEEHLLQLS